MCDALVALGDVTRDSTVIFAKNSDRPVGECQVLHRSPSRSPREGRAIQCSYLRLPDGGASLTTLGCRPYWCWGYETGVNEAGVAGGNTAIFTRSLHLDENRRLPGLTGMDLLRLGLERGDTAEKSVEIMIELLERHGQWGSAVQGRDHEQGSYENAFLLADRRECWALETSGRRWIAERVESGCRTLSNQPSIRREWTNISPDMESFALEMNWWPSDREAFDFAYVYGDHERYSRQVSNIRWKRTFELLRQKSGNIDVPSMMRVLRDHYEDTFLDGPEFHQFLPDFHTICMHDSPNRFTWGDTATSFVTELASDSNAPPRLWIAYLPPCVSIYIGFAWTDALPSMLTRPGQAGLSVCAPEEVPADAFDSASLWWRLHRIVEAVKVDPPRRAEEVAALFRPLERRNLERVSMLHRLLASEAEWTELLEEQLNGILDIIEEIEKRWAIE